MAKEDDVSIEVRITVTRENLEAFVRAVMKAAAPNGLDQFIAMAGSVHSGKRDSGKERWLSQKEVALMLGISTRGLRRWQSLGLIQAVPTTGVYPKYRQSEVDAIIEKGLRPWPEDVNAVGKKRKRKFRGRLERP